MRHPLIAVHHRGNLAARRSARRPRRPSVMLEPYPRARSSRPIQTRTPGCGFAGGRARIRQIRGELDVPHSRATPVYVQTHPRGRRRGARRAGGTIGQSRQPGSSQRRRFRVRVCRPARSRSSRPGDPSRRSPVGRRRVGGTRPPRRKRRAKTGIERDKCVAEARRTPASSRTHHRRSSPRSANGSRSSSDAPQSARQMRRLASVQHAGANREHAAAAATAHADPVEAAVSSLGEFILARSSSCDFASRACWPAATC